jgi:hypothetical protein
LRKKSVETVSASVAAHTELMACLYEIFLSCDTPMCHAVKLKIFLVCPSNRTLFRINSPFFSLPKLFQLGQPSDSRSPEQETIFCRLRSKKEESTLTCDFCSFKSKTRASHNIHLSTCKSSECSISFPQFRSETC